MQKKLIALAVAGAFVAPAAFAESGNVTIYGVMDASYDITDNGNSTTAQGERTNKVSSNSSRIGFKGSEDLGNGLSAVWQLETGINVDGTTDSNLNSRNTFVGLSGKTWGTVILGRHDTPYKLSTRSLDMFADGLADNRNIMGGGSSTSLGSNKVANIAGTGTAATLNGSVASFDGRQSNVVAYISPTMNGFTAAIAYVAGAESAATSGNKKGNAWSAMANYSNGPWYGALAYERHNFGTAGTGSLGPTVYLDKNGTTADISDRSEHAWKLGVGYKANNFRVGFAYEKTSDDLGNVAALKCGSSDCLGHNAWNLGGGYTFGNNEVKVQYTKAGDMGSTANSGAKQWAIGLDHNFSKRTKIYAQYVKLSNDVNAQYGLNGAGATGTVNAKGLDADPSAWSFGMRHSF
ncbi:MAG: porin [Sulfuricellaceae bacterium]